MNINPLENKISHWQQQIDSIASLIQSNIAVLIHSNDNINTTNVILTSKDHTYFPSDNVLYNQLNETIMSDTKLNASYVIKPIVVPKTNTELGYIFIEKTSINPLDLTGILDVMSGYFQYDLVITHTPKHLQKASYDEFISNLHRSLMHAKRINGTLSVFYLEIENVVSITSNKIFDEKEKANCIETLKVMIEERLRCNFRAEDIVMHLYDNAFAAILVNFDCETHLLALSNRQEKVFEDPFAYYGEQVSCTTNIGCSFYPQDGADATTLFSYAEEAGKNALKDSGVLISIYNDRIGQQLKDDQRIQEYLRSGDYFKRLLHKKEDICHLDSNQLESVKIKLAMDVPELGIISNERLLNIAMKNGLVYDLWLHLLDTSMKQANAWVNEGKSFNTITLRIEEPQLLHERFLPDLEAAVNISEFDSNRVNIVISEDVLLNNQEKVSKLIQMISSLNVLVSLSNIKTYTSRALIQELPIHQLHVFADIVNEMPLDDKAEALFDSVIVAGKQLGLSIIATGIENEAQTEYLLQKGCQLGLGGLYKSHVSEISHAQ